MHKIKLIVTHPFPAFVFISIGSITDNVTHIICYHLRVGTCTVNSNCTISHFNIYFNRERKETKQKRWQAN